MKKVTLLCGMLLALTAAVASAAAVDVCAVIASCLSAIVLSIEVRNG